jgi:LmbE family N-acetylglucosaminyl deacetylase
MLKFSNILAIGAHLDDIEITCGGLLADAMLQSKKITMLVLSDSSYCSYDGKIGRTKEEALAEGKNAANILGADLIILDFPTKDIPFNSISIEAIEEIVNKIKPDLIITHWVYDSHPSHRNTAQATIAACRYYNNIIMFEPVMPSGRTYQGFRGQIYHTVSDRALEIKIAALKAHDSQWKKYGGDDWINAIIARGIHRGFEIGGKNAECFEIVRLHGIL